MILLLAISTATLTYVYIGYLLILRFLAARRPARFLDADSAPSVTILVTAYNEAQHIGQRIENIMRCSLDGIQVEILIASDGSTDETDRIVTSHHDRRVRLYRQEQRRGKSATQNAAIATIATNIVVFTDARTSFSSTFLTELLRPFADPAVGCVDGHLLFVEPGGTENQPVCSMAPAQRVYWSHELQIREAESKLRMLAVASGACMAVRRDLLRILPDSVGEDCVVPLDVVCQGYEVRHASAAVAFDTGAHDAADEFRARVRMTLRNWQGTWRYRNLLNPLRHPRIALALWSHKILKWLSPAMLFGFWISSVWLIAGGTPAWILGVPGTLLLFLSLLAVSLPKAREQRALRLLWAFLVANAGFAVGVTRALTGSRITIYR